MTIKHSLRLSAGDDPKGEDFEVVHIIYRLDTTEFVNGNTAIKHASTGYRVVDLDPWDENNIIPRASVDNDILETWLSEKVDLDLLKQENINNLVDV